MFKLYLKMTYKVPYDRHDLPVYKSVCHGHTANEAEAKAWEAVREETAIRYLEVIELHQNLSEMENIPTSEWEDFVETLELGEVRVGLEPLKGRVV